MTQQEFEKLEVGNRLLWVEKGSLKTTKVYGTVARVSAGYVVVIWSDGHEGAFDELDGSHKSLLKYAIVCESQSAVQEVAA